MYHRVWTLSQKQDGMLLYHKYSSEEYFETKLTLSSIWLHITLYPILDDLNPTKATLLALLGGIIESVEFLINKCRKFRYIYYCIINVVFDDTLVLIIKKVLLSHSKGSGFKMP